MGRNKLLLQIGGESVLRRAARRALAAGLDPVVVVLGHEADRTRREVEDLPCRCVVNREYASGMCSSLRAGLDALPTAAGAAVVILADMPYVSAEMIAALVERYRSRAAALVVSEYGGVRAPPTLYSRSLFGELASESGDGCGQRVIRRHAEQAVVLSWPAAALADLDVPADYERARLSVPPLPAPE
jgi:molybdenum cofactor cytidylyltransferase